MKKEELKWILELVNQEYEGKINKFLEKMRLAKFNKFLEKMRGVK